MLLSMLAPADDSQFGSDGIGWLLLRELLADVLKGNYIVLGPAMWVFIGVLGAFVVTRGITRFIRRRSVAGVQASGPIKDITIGGVHIHHQVFGITLMFLTGLLLVATTPDGALLDVLALLFGVGVGVAFDEFALWLHLDDVYWSEQGRKSVDAVAIVLVIVASVRSFLDLLQVFQTSDEMGDLAWMVWLLVAITVIPAVICLLKGKLVTSALGIVYQPIGIVGAFRLAKPGSWWARQLYGPQSRRRGRSNRRFGENYSARLERWRDIVGGAPADRPANDVNAPTATTEPPA
ncbi:MAG: hypothetical protein ABWZ98_11380 [Nakamurella sp.]